MDNTSYIRAMLSKYKAKGAVIDSTLLLLLILGNYDIRSVGRDRTQKYSANDHRLMVRITDYLDKIIITPNILTEVDNLSRQHGTDTARLANVVRSMLIRLAPKNTRFSDERWFPGSLAHSMLIRFRRAFRVLP